MAMALRSVVILAVPVSSLAEVVAAPRLS